MKKILILSALSLVAFLGCKKDKDGGTKPILTFKSASTLDVPKEMEEVLLYFNVKDGDGDLEDHWHVVELFHYADTTKFDAMPLPKLESHKGTKLDAEMIIILSDVRQGNFLPLHWENPVYNPDTVQYKVFVTDNAGNSSDTITTPKIVLRR
ncbi:hypothetical protein [Chitinophaga caseinilytica]|uniref:DUF4625 domain-containing protein n=1 Tax=Chitinophaga caseinilytica TaxID=2267521 RepID=A0ABZ2Z9R1_9BACT